MNLRRRLAIALGITAFLSVVIAALVSAGLVRNFAERNAREDLRRLARAVAVDAGGIDVPDPIRLGQLRRVLQVGGHELALVRPDGSVAGGSTTGIAVARAIDASAVFGGSEVEGTVRLEGEDYVYIATPVTARPVRGRIAPVGGAVISRPLALTRDLWTPMVARIAIAGLGAALLAVAASAFVASRLMRPVRSLSDAANRIAHGELEHRVPVEGDDELGELGHAFNDMSAALGEAQRREREFLASVSHELRTPITAIKGYAEALQEGAIADDTGREDALRIIMDEGDRLERMIRDIMDLARLGARRFSLDVRDVDLRSTLEEAVRAHRAQADDARVVLVDDLPDALPARTDPDRVRQIVSNLVDNALRVTGEGGTIAVRARTIDDGSLIEITDTGPGIAPEDLPHVFERTYLWRASKGHHPVGTGLGLAIVRELVGALGGDVAVTSEPGRGTTFRMRLPARVPSDA